MLLFQGIRDGLKNILLSPEESHHCFKVTRHRAGDTVLVTDFGGIIWSGKIVGIANDQGNIEIIEIYKELVPKGGKITLGVSLTNHLDRFEWFLEKAVETGVDQIYPMACARTKIHKEKRERWEKIILSAAKQTLRPSLPILEPLIKIDALLKTNRSTQRFICHCEEGAEHFLGTDYDPDLNVIVLIGPEGDFTLAEIESSLAAGFKQTNLGDYRLRTETAALATCIILQTVKTLNE
ncbi:MAG: 16S rRNA (uracil(1498)-N(3))-methyltransferase [Saprospiraceae bacterium]|nr:16S rRNA (uracil(1498)-N(3))-methyltransferase [Candidatus Vicinibacter affinis]